MKSDKYIWGKSYQKNCCDKWDKHIALQMLETVRNIFMGAMDRNTFDECTVSSCVNFMVAEATVLEHLDCKNRAIGFWHVNNAACLIIKNMNAIIDKCGRDRGVRTIKKFLSIQTQHHYLSYYNITTDLINIYSKTGELADRINLCAVRFLDAHNHYKNAKIYAMSELHKLQSKMEASQFETISTILQKLDKREYGMNLTFDALNFLFFQLQIEIRYPQLNAECRNKIIEDLSGTDAYKNNRHTSVNLIKANVRILQCMIDIDYYKSIVVFRDYHQTFNEDVMSFKYEKRLIENLRESLGYFAKFLQDKDRWPVGKETNDYLSNMETMLRKIGQWLINRQYKELAVTAFDLLYQVAKLSNSPLQQIIASGFLVENISLNPKIFIEDEIAAELQSNILKKFKDVAKMSQDELRIFLLGFLQLTMYTLRRKHNMQHAKKYMEAISKLLDNYDSEKEKYAALRLKYSEVMFEMIVNDPNASITPITFIEDIFHRFKSIRFNCGADVDILPGILFDILNTLYEYTQARYEFHHISSLMYTLLNISMRSGYIFLLAKVIIITTSEYLHNKGKWEVSEIVRLSHNLCSSLSYFFNDLIHHLLSAFTDFLFIS